MHYAGALAGLVASLISILVFFFPSNTGQDSDSHSSSVIPKQELVTLRQGDKPLNKIDVKEIQGVGKSYRIPLAPAPFQILVDEPSCAAPDAGFFVHALEDVDEGKVSQELARMRQQGYPRSDVFLFGHIAATEENFVTGLYSSEFTSDFAPEMNNPFLVGWNYFDYERVYDRDNDTWTIQVGAISGVSFSERPVRKIVLVIGETDCVDERAGWDLEIVNLDWMR